MKLNLSDFSVFLSLIGTEKCKKHNFLTLKNNADAIVLLDAMFNLQKLVCYDVWLTLVSLVRGFNSLYYSAYYPKDIFQIKDPAEADRACIQAMYLQKSRSYQPLLP